jgi:hypothetical protein
VPIVHNAYKDLPLRINFLLELILFADVKISSRNFEDFCSVSYSVLSHMIKQFAANNLILNLDKTIMMKLITKNSAHLMFMIPCIVIQL